jgi:hypothetical protein
MHRAFEVFARASSQEFFRHFAPVLGTATADELRAAISEMKQYGDGFNSEDPRILTGFAELATRP